DIKNGRDPAITKKLKKLTTATQREDTFEIIAREWFALNKPQWVERHADKVIESFELHVFPSLGAIPIRDIEAPEVLS
ncbi:phage integrase central domain-containing protein, partial [Aeromonas veronii]|uniref:phage integrase central domain-containing protein n=1 Tax=Aeromonas veronii TaxID=654 RepID=UPI00406C9033